MAAQAASSFSALESLPLLVLKSVCEYLAASDSRRRSLYAFSLTSRLCCAMADRLRFEQIQFAVEDGQQLERILARWDDILRVGKRTSYVRSVKITGRMGFDGEDWAQARRAKDFQESTDWDDDEDYVDEDGISRPKSLDIFDGSKPVCSAENKATSNRLWQPLASFLSKFHALKHFIWASTDQVPRCILDMLHTQLPHSLLHVNTFSLRSLYQWSDQLHDVDEDEYALATSPCLSSICVATCYYDSDGRQDYNGEAALDIASGLAPNLRSVYMYYKITGNSIGLQYALRIPRPPWRGLIVGKEDRSQKSKAQLHTFAPRHMFLSRLQTWKRHIDFSALRSLDIGLKIDLPTIQELSNMAEAGVFKCLRILSLPSLGREKTQDAINFLSALSPLESLSIREDLEEALISSILDRHGGASLRRLLLPGCLLDGYIKNMCKGCPNLRELGLSVKRRQGNEQEVSLYKALGSFPRFERLTLQLDCCDPEISAYEALGTYPRVEPPIEGEKQVHRIHEALINSAIDANLAHSIFSTILAANHAVHPQTAPSFRYLKLRPFCGNGMDFVSLQCCIARSWICEREGADLHSKVKVRESRVTERVMNMEALNEFVEEDFRQIWEAVWPESKGKTNWLEEWHSFPLYSNNPE